MVKSNGRPPIEAQHRTRLGQIRDEASELAGTMLKVVQMIDQVLEDGGTVDMQRQMAFLTSVCARMGKDWGVVEHLQALGASQRRPPQVR